MTDKAMLEPPFVASAFEIYKDRVTDGGETKITPMRELELMQAFYAGATEGLNISATLEHHPKRTFFEKILKEELEHYSKANHELAEQIGARVSTMKGRT
jgi:hypothetical protein